MSSVPLQTSNSPIESRVATRPPSGRWILNSSLDLLLFVLTPLLVVPIVLLIQTPWVGVEVETISLIVSAFGGLGHHLPGMIRAYCDRDLFERFRMRFILAPLFILAVCIPLSQYHLNAMLLVLSVWGCWHALMQVYGFVRIYDVKVGSVSSVTAHWDWLMCLTWFSTAQVFSNGKMSRLLEHFYNSGGPLIPPIAVHTFRWICLAISVVVLIGFLVNHASQTVKGPAPNSVKLLMLLSGIGFWWFAMVYVDDIVLGIALFEIFHDIQYLAIVWLYNCRRVNTNPSIGSFMRFVFRRGWGMLMLYIGLVFAYGFISFTSRFIESDEWRRVLTGFIWASTILHFYFDGFIWKVRDNATRTGLGISSDTNSSNAPSFAWKGEIGHLLKWAPLIIFLSWLTGQELRGSYLESGSDQIRQWPILTQFDRVQNIAAAVPGDLRAQRRAATTLANLDRQPEAIELMKSVLRKNPRFSGGHLLLGDIHMTQANFEMASLSYREAAQVAKTPNDLAVATHQQGEVYLALRRTSLAKSKFQDALKILPDFKPSKERLIQLNMATSPNPDSSEVDF
ncbi:MAG: hypothetical protein FJ267_00545 [Planctomycetes bacterium]|nr:hypothetical protein [Planctomycetota bacterium]